MKLYSILIALLLLGSLAYSVNVVVTGNPSFDSDGNTITTNVSGIGGTNASKTCGIGLCTYNINGTFPTPYGSITDANYTTTFTQDVIALLGNTTQGYGFANGTEIDVCVGTDVTLPTTPTNFTCNVIAGITTTPSYLFTRVTALVVASTFTYDYAAVNITAGATVITSIPVTLSSPGTYVLDSNLTNGTPTAITIGSNDVILDCQGHSLTGTYTNSTQGIAQNGVNNFTVQNCIIREYGTNLFYGGGNVSLFLNNTFDNSSQTNVLVGSLTNTSLLNFSQNIVSNGFNNGIEDYSCTNCVFDNNTIFGQLLGHGTDRGFQFVTNNNFVSFTNNLVSNNTFCLRSDNNNLTNILVAHNTCLNNLNGLNQQAIVGTYSNVTYLNNSITSTVGADFSWAGISTSVTMCAQTIVVNNTASGLPYLWFNKSNDGQTISNLNIGSFGVCDADNLIMSNITTTSPLGTINNEFMQANNETLNGLVCNNARICLRGLNVNDSSFSDIYSLGGTLSAINFLGGQAFRNNISNFTIINGTGLLGAALGGTNNSMSGGYIFDSNPTAGAIGYQSATVSIGNVYDNIRIYNSPIGIIFTLSSGNLFRNIYLENDTQALLINSSSVGSKTYAAYNTTVAFSGGVNTTSFDIADIVVPNQSYTIKTVTNPYGIPAGINDSFRGKGLNLTIINTTTAFSGFNFTWLQSEVSGFNEPSISLYSNNGSGWVLLNDTPDTGNNRISFTGPFNEGSSNVLALFADLENCPIINESGTYLQTRNYENATNPSAPYLEYTCVDIRASDVIWDCQGFNITNLNNSNISAGVLAIGNNITTRNCNIAGYSYQEYANGNNIVVTNNTFDSNGELNTVGYSIFLANGGIVFNNTFRNLNYGTLFFFGTVNYNISHNTYFQNTLRDIDGGTTTGSTFEFNNFTLGNVGISLLNSNGNQVIQNNFTSEGFIALQLVGADATNVSSNNFQGNSYSIDISSSANNNNIEFNNITNTGFGTSVSISQSNSNTITTNTISGSTQALVFLDPTSSFNSVTNNLMGSSVDGVHDQGLNNIISLNSISNTQNGILLEGNATNLFNNVVFSNIRGISILSGSGSQTFADHLYDNDQDWFMNNTASFASTFTVVTELFDNPLGNLVNYSQITFGVSLPPGESYSLSWTNQPVPDPLLPANTTVPGQFLNFTSFSGTPTLTNSDWFFTPTVVNRVIFYNGTWNNLSSTAFLNRLSIPIINTTGIYALAQVTLAPVEITLVTLEYVTATPYTNYTFSGNSVTVQDTGDYLINYLRGGAGDYSMFIIFFGGAFFFIVIKYLMDSELI